MEGPSTRVASNTGIGHVVRCFTHPDFEGTHGLGDVPDFLFAKIRKCNWMLAQVFAHTAGHADSPGFSE